MAVAKRGMTSALAAMAWAMVVSLGLGGCGVVMDPGSVLKNGDHSQDAMGALGRGDLARAEEAGVKALRDNPHDPYALLALAIVYQNTGRAEVARQYYQVLLSMHSQALVMNGPGGQPKTVDEIARMNLGVLDGEAPPILSAVMVSSGRPAADAGNRAFDEDGNVIRRFRTLRRLLELGLITHDEYEQRRSANLGALLQYSAPQAPAYGLGYSAPEPAQVVERLNAIAANFEEHSISAEEQSTERGIILEALMPAKVDRRADRPQPVADDLQYSAKMGRLQRLLDAGVITKAEAERERKMLSSQLATANAQKEAAMAASRAAAMRASEATVPASPAPTPIVPAPLDGHEGLALGSYGSKRGAERAWQSLQQQFPAELGALSPRYGKTYNRRRGSTYHLSAGPLASTEEAEKACRALKLFDLTCSPTHWK